MFGTASVRDHRGWWLAIGFATLTTFGSYVGTYYALVQRVVPSHHLLTLACEPQYRHLGSAGRLIFAPLHIVDRRLRPVYWGDELDEHALVRAAGGG